MSSLVNELEKPTLWSEGEGRWMRARITEVARIDSRGSKDGMSWKNDYPVPGRTNYTLLFDRDHQPKPALDAVLAVPVESGSR